MLIDEVIAPADAQGTAAHAQMAALEQLVQRQAQLMQQQAQQLRELRASPAHSPQQSPAHSPQQSPAAQPQSRFARKEPRAQDLREYDGASGAKLDEWLLELSRAVRLFQLNDREAVDFGVSRLAGAALQWSLTLDAAQQAAIADAAALGAALRARFQPVTAARVAREQLRALRQGGRGINDYIADFQRLRAQLPTMAEDDALFAFEAGVNRDIAVELRKHRVQTVADAISLAAHVGSIGSATMAPAAGHRDGARALAHQMEIDDGGDASLEGRISRAVLNAMQSQQAGMGAKTQTQRGYQQERGGGSGARGRGGRFGGASRPPMAISIPGVPAPLVEQRRAAGQCFRCGSGDHRSIECPNAISASPSSF
jgi:hypothetical protein